jgi:hypothetical protein
VGEGDRSTTQFHPFEVEGVRAIGFEFEVRLLIVHKLTTPVQRMRGRSFCS